MWKHFWVQEVCEKMIRVFPSWAKLLPLCRPNFKASKSYLSLHKNKIFKGVVFSCMVVLKKSVARKVAALCSMDLHNVTSRDTGSGSTGTRPNTLAVKVLYLFMKINGTFPLVPTKMPNSLQDSKLTVLLIRSCHTSCPSAVSMIKQYWQPKDVRKAATEELTFCSRE